ncbi:hypothetical protein MNBD_CHLOROFLEXI01-1657 [hydrothermal vent metagenome]|uniref:DUF4007 domain-containing protein n=1 Tax=hydrothermal vent metagenome TaxID=652676 RepID=A0A3B0WF67_9ZZZZ
MFFSKHETFHIREGWLFKGMAAIESAEDLGELPTIFLDKNAPERLGIGRNMVHALRFWMQATGLTKETREENRTIQRLTPFGRLVWDQDPYLEDDTTLWLIHYQLVSNPEQATTWFWFFNYYAPISFVDDVALRTLNQWIITEEPNRRVAESSLKKDIDCLIRTYLPDERVRTPEYLLESPFARLGVLTAVSANSQKRYHVNRVTADRINPLAILFAMLFSQEKNRPGTYQVRLSQVLQEPMNAGRVFNMTTATLTEVLAHLEQEHPDLQVRFERTAGLDQLTLPNVGIEEVLARCYTSLPEVA